MARTWYKCPRSAHGKGWMFLFGFVFFRNRVATDLETQWVVGSGGDISRTDVCIRRRSGGSTKSRVSIADVISVEAICGLDMPKEI
jgi:hypothetical protein